MSYRAIKWSSIVRGCNIAEHAVLSRLASYHNKDTGECYPRQATLAYELECSPNYLKHVLQNLEKKGFITRQAEYRGGFKKPEQRRQTANRHILHLDHFFPKDEQSPRLRMNLLGLIRDTISPSQRALRAGILDVWVQPPKPNGRRKRPAKATLWIAIESPSHERFVLETLPAIAKRIVTEVGKEFHFEFVRVYLGKKD